MARILNEQEVQAIIEAEKILIGRGFESEGSTGGANAALVKAYLELNTGIPATVTNILAAVEAMKDRMAWKSSAEVAYNSVFGSLSEIDKGSFAAWWFKQKQVVILGNPGYENAVKLLNWCKGRAVSATVLDQAVSNLAGSRDGLHWTAKRDQIPQGRPARAGDGPPEAFMPKDQHPDQLSGKHRHSLDHDEKKETFATKLDQNEAKWKEMSEAKLASGSHHSMRILREVFELGANGSQSWANTFRQLAEIVKNQSRV